MITFIDLTKYKNSEEKEKNFFKLENRIILDNANEFTKIPGSPIAYTVNQNIRKIFESPKFEVYSKSFQGIITGNNDKYLRMWFEISNNKISFNVNSYKEVDLKNKYWIPYNKGGEFRKWYGNQEQIVNWAEKGKNFTRGKYQFKEYFFKEYFSWSYISTSTLATRFYPNGFLWDVHGSGAFPYANNNLFYLLALISSKTGLIILNIINPTISFQVENILSMPVIFPSDESIKQKIDILTQECIDISKEEWDSRETSWDFKINQLLKHKNSSNKLEVAYQNYCTYWKEKFFKLHKNEEELNQLFIDIYDLNDELDNKVPLTDITILKDETEIIDNHLLFKKEVVVKQLLSYIVGCIFGRFNPEKEGSILANQGETLDDFKVESKFMPDNDNIIPVTDRDYFLDDIVGRVKEFLKIYFGAETITENLDFIASALKGGGSSEEKLRKYFLKEFYKDHIKMYKKKPIYWMFTSGPDQGFNTLIYMHRYNKELLAKMRVDYLHALQGKIDVKINMIKEEDLKSEREKETLSRQFEEMRRYDDLLNHKASEYIEIDLDDGVDINYEKFNGLVEKV